MRPPVVPNSPLTLFCYTALSGSCGASPCGRPHVNAEAGNVGFSVRTLPRLVCAVMLAALAAGCAQQSAPLPPAPVAAVPQCVPFVQQGVASWYGPTHHGRLTASGVRFDMNGLTAAHRTLPLGTEIEVENLDNGRKVQVAVTTAARTCAAASSTCHAPQRSSSVSRTMARCRCG